MRKTMSFLIILLLFASPVFGGAPVSGDKAPNFTLSSLAGEKFSLDALKGKVVLVGMFHICVPCMNQAMELNKVRDKIKSDKLKTSTLSIMNSAIRLRGVMNNAMNSKKPLNK